MKNYPLEDRVNMILVLGECLENCLLASRVYAERFPLKEHPRKEVFERLLARFRETGSVAYKKREIQKPITGNEDKELLVLQSLVENPTTSGRNISKEVDVSRSSIRRIIKKHRYHPYHIQLHQNLYGNDFERRVEFCIQFLEKEGENEHFFKNVLFTDEASFHNNGLVNRHNFHYYSTENNHQYRTVDHQNRWSLNVYGGIIGDHVIGPHFFNGHLNGRTFLRFLRREFWIMLQNVPLNVRRDMWLQLDGAPAHFARNVRDYLDTRFPGKWIGRGGPHHWPPRSPDLTPMDYFLWGYVKNIVYSTAPTTAQDMKTRIQDAFATITPEMLRNVRTSFEKRLMLCIQEDGHHIEPLL